jgi:hypothetical protein
MDTEDFKTASWIGDANIDFTIEAAEATKGRVNRVWSVRGSHDDNIRASLKTIHKGEKLRDDTTLHLAVGLEINSISI